MKLVDPFGDGVNDLNVTGMKEVSLFGSLDVSPYVWCLTITVILLY